MKSVVEALRDRVGRLPAGLRDHVFRVETEAHRLAAVYGLDAGRLQLAVLGHDLYRAHGPKQLLSLAAVLIGPPNAVEEAEPILLHGPLAALAMQVQYGIDDAETLDAARYHTTARPGMTLFEKALFLADKIEPEKVDRIPELEEVRRLAGHDPDEALLRFLNYQVRRSTELGWLLHPNLVAARNELLLARR
jgi:predicted HD superfamily hydrolase involved in NAD metabolism